MIAAIKEVMIKLMDDIPVIIRGALLTLIVIVGLGVVVIKVTGITPQSIRTAQQVIEIEDNSILLNKRCKKYGYGIVDDAATKLFKEVNGTFGVAILGAEPEMQARILRVVARDGIKLFNEVYRSGSTVDIDSQVPREWLSMRSSIPHIQNVSETGTVYPYGVRSMIAFPIEYQTVVIGTIMIFLDKSLGSYSDKEMGVIVAKARNEADTISRKLYYDKDKR
jgi:hypothetical protein